MTKLADMSLSKAERKESMPQAVSESDGPRFPYGLTLRLDNASLEKLGIDSLPKVGAKMVIQAEGVVISVSSHESENRDDRNVEIQIQKLAVSDDDDDSNLSLERIMKRKSA